MLEIEIVRIKEIGLKKLFFLMVWYVYGMFMVCLWYVYGMFMVCLWYGKMYNVYPLLGLSSVLAFSTLLSFAINNASRAT